MSANWPSAQWLAEIDRWVLEVGFQCDVSVIRGTARSSEQRLKNPAETAIWVPEYWQGEQPQALPGIKQTPQAPYPQAGAAVYVSADWLAQNPQVTDVETLLLQFGDSDAPWTFYGCPLGWACQVPIHQWFRAMQWESEGWLLVEPAGAADWEMRLERARQNPERPWVGYTWGPSIDTAQANLLPLPSTLAFQPDHYERCYTDPGCSSPRAMGLPPSRVTSAASGQWLEANPGVSEYFMARQFSVASVHGWLRWIDQNGTPEKAAEEYLATDDEWHGWVPGEVKERILKRFN